MCGLAGFWGPAQSDVALRRVGKDMADAIRHRGPDDSGVWCDPQRGIALAHRRLSILDLSTEGQQPMRNADGSLVLVYNGEVYNYRSLRDELKALGASFRSETDTEVVLRGIEHWGLEETLGRLVGMFALALFDRNKQRLFLARDRFGIKPLYHGCVGGRLFFASELGAIRSHPDFHPELDPDSLALFFRHNYVPDPYSIYRGVAKLSPGGLIEYDGPRPAKERLWWDTRRVAAEAAAEPLVISASEATDRLEAVLSEAVSQRMVADVPLGAFLSGGIDSSLVVALMQRASDRPVDTFTIGFQEKGYDEAGPAREVARHLGTNHHELVLTSTEARAVVPHLAEMWDEPFSDASQIPTHCVSRFAREHVTVALSGDGGDELTGGYTRYHRMCDLTHRLKRVPRGLRSALGTALERSPNGLWEGLARWIPQAHRGGLVPGRAAHRVARLGELLRGSSDDTLYRAMVSHWKEPSDLVYASHEPATALVDPVFASLGMGQLERMMLIDTVSYLPGDILTKVDRASMAVSLEARVPLLDHRVFELLWRLPAEQRIGPKPGKAILRRLLARYLPRTLFERPKMGFGVPMGTWLRGPLREWAEELLDPRRLESEGILAGDTIRTVWKAHLEGPVDWGAYIYDVCVFQAWRERWL